MPDTHTDCDNHRAATVPTFTTRRCPYCGHYHAVPAGQHSRGCTHCQSSLFEQEDTTTAPPGIEG